MARLASILHVVRLLLPGTWLDKEIGQTGHSAGIELTSHLG